MSATSFIIGLIAGFIIAYVVITYYPTLLSRTPLCKPSYVWVGTWGGEDTCKLTCYGGAKVTSYKKDTSPPEYRNFTEFSCFCDVNNCNPK